MNLKHEKHILNLGPMEEFLLILLVEFELLFFSPRTCTNFIQLLKVNG